MFLLADNTLQIGIQYSVILLALLQTMSFDGRDGLLKICRTLKKRIIITEVFQ